MIDELGNLIDILQQIKQANALPNYIDYIQFPFFRNIEIDQRIHFEFPFTAFVGPNGSGKSSTLHAIYGCPEGKTPYDFWFSTSLDPISYYSTDGRKLRHSFFYGYKDQSGQELQVIKARIQRENNPDYWETSRPIISAGMNDLPEGRRNPPIKKNVIYFDFRSELSAFDKYFYYEKPPSYLASRTKQDYLRDRSRKLKNLFLEKYRTAKSHRIEQNKEVEILTKDELSVISELLGRNYLEAKIIFHKLFHNWGYSIRLKTKFHNYSEAFAGSGEIAVIRLIHAVLNAENNSLIILDEPEVSLHPGAQKRLKCFLLDQIKKKKHQIIISTHSPAMIENLPKEAIKVFSQKLDTGKFVIKENIIPEEAFYFIGQNIGDKINIIVEDTLSKKILDRVFSNIGEQVANRFDVKFTPGGSSVIQQQIAAYSITNLNKIFFVFDGDQKRTKDLVDVQSLSESNKNVAYLSNEILKQTGVNIKFYVNGSNEGGNESQRIQLMINYLRYYKNHVFYLPLATPEDLIWSENVIHQKFNLDDYNSNIDRIRAIQSNKERIFESAKVLFGVDNNIDGMENILITEWIKSADSNYQSIVSIISRIGVENL